MSAESSCRWGGFLFLFSFGFNLSQVKSSGWCHLFPPPPTGFGISWKLCSLPSDYGFCWSTEPRTMLWTPHILSTRFPFLLPIRKVLSTGQPVSLLNFLCYYVCSNCKLLNKMLLRGCTFVFLHLFYFIFFFNIDLIDFTKSLHFSDETQFWARIMWLFL